MNFIKLHFFDKIEDGYKYRGEIVINVKEITFIKTADLYLKNMSLEAKDREVLQRINENEKLSIVNTTLVNLDEVLVVESVRDIFDYIR